MENEEQDFAAHAQTLIGKYVLIGITYVNSGGDQTKREQKHGEIVRASWQEGIVVRLGDQSEYYLPPYIDGLQPANPGIYHLHETGEEVADPDFVCTFTVIPKTAQGN